VIERSVIGTVGEGSAALEIPRLVFRGRSGGMSPIKLGLFATVHGDEPAGAEALQRLLQRATAQPELAHGFELFCYPVCNPTGLEDCARHNRAGVDLNREFWRGSVHPEVIALERELRVQQFDGVVALHADCDSRGLYAFARGAVIVHELVEPALAAAEGICPRNGEVTIDGFHAKNGVIHDWYPGVLGPPVDQWPVPFEIVLETPGLLPVNAQADAALRAVLGLLDAVPRLRAVAADI
jgi:hypothetical protein